MYAVRPHVFAAPLQRQRAAYVTLAALDAVLPRRSRLGPHMVADGRAGVPAMLPPCGSILKRLWW